MPFDRFFIGPYASGVQQDLRPFLIMDDAFTLLQNLYVFRGRVRKRFGGRLSGYGWDNVNFPQLGPYYSRVKIQLGGSGDPVVTNGSGNASGTVPGTIFDVGAAFTIGNAIYTVYQLGTPANMKQTIATTTATFNTSTGAFNFVGAPINSQVYFYPGEPIMGFSLYDQNGVPVNDQPSWAFDTQFAYVFTGGQWIGQPTPLWHDPSGEYANFFWIANWDGIGDNDKLMYVTNYQVSNPTGAPTGTDDPIYFYDGTTWTAFTPAFLPNGGTAADSPFVQTAKIIVQFKDRLCLLNTIESDNEMVPMYSLYTNRVRYSQNGNPTEVNAYYEPNQIDAAGNISVGGGYLDAATDEAIVSAEFIKDRLIVYFERSTWELVYTGNEVIPFRWQKINTELGSQSLQSSIPFDKEILTIGNVGVHSCSGANVQRIDEKIPDIIFTVRTSNQGSYRIAGIRDYFTELAYWTFPSQRIFNSIFPDSVLVYNYRNSTWAGFDDCITAFGYLEQQQTLTWDTWTWTWDESQQPWSGGMIQNNSQVVIAGNQQGYIFILDDDMSRNAPVMQITNIVITSVNVITLTIINHTLNDGSDYIVIENAQGVNMGILNNGSYQIQTIIDANTVTITNFGVPVIGTTYTGGGSATRVSNLRLKTKQWNPYLETDQNLALQRIEFGVVPTTSGSITVDYAPSAADVSTLSEATATNSILGTGILDTFPYTTANYPGALNDMEAVQDRLWHRVYFQTYGECVQLNMYFSDTQMADLSIIWENFELDGMILITRPTGRLQS